MFPALWQKRNAAPSRQIAHAQRRSWSGLVGRMPVESISRRKYEIVLIDEYSRCKLGAPFESQIRCPRRVGSMGREDGERNEESCLTTRIAELVVRSNKEYCKHKRSRINTSVPYSPSSNGIAERLVGVTTNGTRDATRLETLAVLHGRIDDDLQVPAQQDGNEGKRRHKAV